ncbi:multicopper oxidase family protein [Longimicrobium sp.]|uniref:multicopper oxidase family protein n=1 Tax=Longimicrobium sp. TaxID=2029185 RepID=UPI002E37D300|nr:multicopper oxidase family protein [Longimicrobium sp.]HEX6036495.1 multicopper oxidase family protein [Longimicrobium sp.]
MRLTRPTAAGALLAAGLAAAHPSAAQIRVETAPPLASQRCTNVMDPPMMRAAGATLTMSPAQYDIGGMPFATNVYNNGFVAPTLTMQAGEPLNLTVVNDMGATANQPADEVRWTNSHYHGLVVTPNPAGGDNVTHVRIDRGGRRSYNFPVPAGHTEGMFWYHPHPHGISSSQVAGGLSGALLVGSVTSYFPQYANAPERVMLIRDMSFDLMKSVALLNINGNPCSRLPVRPGGQQLWHIGNFGSNVFVNLKLEGARWTLLALDGNPLLAPMQMDSLYLPPGTRAEVIVTGPAAGDSVRLFSAPMALKLGTPEVTLGWVIGDPAAPGSPPPPAGAAPAGGPTPQILAQVERLRTATDVNRHTFKFSFPGEVTAAVNDSIYEPNHRPVSVPWGQVQEWTIVNASSALHTFHIHQTDFLVVSVNGRPADEGLLRDNVPVGVHRSADGQRWEGDTVVVRFVFDPIAAGPFVFHCHVLQHEDEGMMHNVCVYDPNDPAGPRKCDQMFTGNGHGH